ncbi:hypothetical protein MRX96_049994 [Rhipicephalus microplus]
MLNYSSPGEHNLNVPHGFSLEYGDEFVSNLVKHVSLTGSRLHAKAALSPNLTLGGPRAFRVPDTGLLLPHGSGDEHQLRHTGRANGRNDVQPQRACGSTRQA